MGGDYFKVQEFVRGVVDGKVVVRRPGARIPVALAVQLGLLDAPVLDGKGRERPRKPAGATPPKRRSASKR